MEAPFMTPQNDTENRIKESITAFPNEQTSKLEQDLFKQRTSPRGRSPLVQIARAAVRSQ
jgi:hypothetical protein